MIPATRMLILAFVALTTAILSPTNSHGDDIIVSVGHPKGMAGKEVTVFISLKNVKGTDGVGAMSFGLSFDPNVVSFKSIEMGAAVPKGAIVDHTTGEKETPGRLGVGLICGKGPGIDTDGTVFKFVFLVSPNAKPGIKTPIKIEKNLRVISAKDNREELRAHAIEGSIEIVDDK
jgi:hypothetical protein